MRITKHAESETHASGSHRLNHGDMGLRYVGGPASRTDDTSFGAAVDGRALAPSLTFSNLA